VTTGTLSLLPPSPPFACSVDLLFRPPFIRLDGDAITAVQNRADGVWHETPDGRRRMRYLGGVARGNFDAAFPALSHARYRNPAAAVLPVYDVPREMIITYLSDCRPLEFVA